MIIKDLLKNIKAAEIVGSLDREITGLTYDSRTVVSDC